MVGSKTESKKSSSSATFAMHQSTYVFFPSAGLIFCVFPDEYKGRGKCLSHFLGESFHYHRLAFIFSKKMKLRIS